MRWYVTALFFGFVVALLFALAALARSQERVPQSGTAMMPAAPVAVTHGNESASGWYVADSTNYRLWHQGTRAQAEEILRAAEAARTRVYQRWFGDPPAAWQPRCELNLYPSRESYQAATGLPDRVPAYAHTQHEGERVLARQIDLRGDWPELLTAVLPHEITHLILSDQFGSRPLPCWANEGIAVLSEPQENIARHLRALPRYRDQGLLCGLGSLMEQTDYPDRRVLGAFYAQSVSLVQFFVHEKGPQTLIAFLHDARRQGFARALRRHYQMDFADLEQRWQQYALSGGVISVSR
jgi:hypothetical protein